MWYHQTEGNFLVICGFEERLCVLDLCASALGNLAQRSEVTVIEAFQYQSDHVIVIPCSS